MSITVRRQETRLRNRGFTYVGLLVLMAILSLVATAGLQAGVLVQRRAAEQELLLIGKEYRLALQSYAAATPEGQNRSPTRVGDLLRDPRFPGVKRHLRKLYADPVTAKEQWGYVRNTRGNGITGIHSLSAELPILTRPSLQGFPEFDGKKSYKEWVFQ